MTALLIPRASLGPPAGTVVRVRGLVRRGDRVIDLRGMYAVVVACAGDDLCRVCLTAWGQVLTLPLAVLEVVE